MAAASPETGSNFADVGGIRVHYHDIGEGPALILLHGGGPGGGGWSNFKQNVPALSKYFRVLIIDQLGYGETDKPEFDGAYYHVSAKLIHDTMDVLGIPQADFIGNSLGGGTSLRLALDYPDYVRRLILMGPGGGAKNIFAPDPAEGQLALLDFYAGDGPSRDKMRAITRVMLYDSSNLSDDLVEERFNAAMRPGAKEGTLRALASIGSPVNPNPNQLWRYLTDIPHETLLIWGRDDRTMPLDGAFFALKQMPNAHLHVFGRCGHWAQLEHRDAFDRLVIDFLKAP
jgi:pimeloyl-ACP methyl ester carboxylesterase